MKTTTPNQSAKINPIDYGKIKSIMDQANTTNNETDIDKAIYNQIAQNFYYNKNKQTIPTPENQILNNLKNEPITTFTTNAIQIPKINILEIIVNTIKFSINALPTLIVFAIMLYFLISIEFNINKIQTFPQWLKNQTELFAKENIIPHITNGNKE